MPKLQKMPQLELGGTPQSPFAGITPGGGFCCAQTGGEEVVVWTRGREPSTGGSSRGWQQERCRRPKDLELEPC